MHFYGFLKSTPIDHDDVQQVAAQTERHLQDEEIASLHDSIEHLQELYGSRFLAVDLAYELNRAQQDGEIQDCSAEFVHRHFATYFSTKTLQNLQNGNREFYEAVVTNTLEKGYLGSSEVSILQHRFTTAYISLIQHPLAEEEEQELFEFNYRIQKMAEQIIVNGGEIAGILYDEEAKINEEVNDMEVHAPWEEGNEFDGDTAIVPECNFLDEELKVVREYLFTRITYAELVERYNKLSALDQNTANNMMIFVVNQVTNEVLRHIGTNPHLQTELERVVFVQNFPPNVFMAEEELEVILENKIVHYVGYTIQSLLEDKNGAFSELDIEDEEDIEFTTQIPEIHHEYFYAKIYETEVPLTDVITAIKTSDLPSKEAVLVQLNTTFNDTATLQQLASVIDHCITDFEELYVAYDQVIRASLDHIMNCIVTDEVLYIPIEQETNALGYTGDTAEGNIRARIEHVSTLALADFEPVTKRGIEIGIRIETILKQLYFKPEFFNTAEQKGNIPTWLGISVGNEEISPELVITNLQSITTKNVEQREYVTTFCHKLADQLYTVIEKYHPELLCILSDQAEIEEKEGIINTEYTQAYLYRQLVRRCCPELIQQ